MSRARIDINISPSLRHEGLVTVILSLTTGLVFPQFHLIYDDYFKTVRPSSVNEMTFKRWQILAGLKHRDNLTANGTKLIDAQRPILTTKATLMGDVAEFPPPSRVSTIDIEQS